MNATKNFSLTLPDGSKRYIEVVSDNNKGWTTQDRIKQEVGQILCLSKITTPRNNPTEISIKVYEQSIKNGQIKENYYCEIKIPVPFEPLTFDTYVEELNDIVEPLPIVFQKYVKQDLADRDQPYEELVCVAKDIVNNLLPAIDEYKKSILLKEI